jgi:hypothetical protein
VGPFIQALESHPPTRNPRSPTHNVARWLQPLNQKALNIREQLTRKSSIHPDFTYAYVDTTETEFAREKIEERLLIAICESLTNRSMPSHSNVQDGASIRMHVGVQHARVMPLLTVGKERLPLNFDGHAITPFQYQALTSAVRRAKVQTGRIIL